MRTPKGDPNATTAIGGIVWQKMPGSPTWYATYNELDLSIESPRSGIYFWTVQDGDESLGAGHVYANAYWAAADEVKSFLNEFEDNRAGNPAGTDATTDPKEN